MLGARGSGGPAGVVTQYGRVRCTVHTRNFLARAPGSLLGKPMERQESI